MISARARRMAACRGVRIQRWRWSIKKSTPCSLSDMGNGSLSETRCSTCTFETSSSYPPGARLSALTFPSTITLDSWVKLLTASKTSGGTAFLGTTPWMIPLPSRKIGNSNFPLSRRLYNQPRIVTAWPSCFPISEIVVTGFISESVSRYSGTVKPRGRKPPRTRASGLHNQNGSLARSTVVAMRVSGSQRFRPFSQPD